MSLCPRPVPTPWPWVQRPEEVPRLSPCHGGPFGMGCPQALCWMLPLEVSSASYGGLHPENFFTRDTSTFSFQTKKKNLLHAVVLGFL